MRRTDLFLVIILVVLVLILVVGIALRPQAGTQQPVASLPTDLEGRLAAAQANVESLQAQLGLPTPAPGSIDFAGWETFTGNGVSLALPSQYEGGEVNEELIDTILAAVPEVGAMLESYGQIDAELFRFMAFDVTDPQTPNVNITASPYDESMGTLEQAAEFVVGFLPSGMTIMRQDIISFQNSTALRFDFENSLVPNVPTMRQLQYTILSGNVVWTMTYTSSSGDFNRRLPTFEISARTFAITA